MLIFTDCNKLFALSEQDRDYISKLQAKDRIYVIAESTASIPMNMFNLLHSLSAKLEFVTGDGVTEFERGFALGKLAGQAKQGEDIVILMNNVSLSAFPDIKCVETFTALGKKSGDASAVKRTRKPRQPKTQTEDDSVVDKAMNPPQIDVKTDKATENTKKENKPQNEANNNVLESIGNYKLESKEISSPLLDAVLVYPKLKPYKSMLTKSESKLREALETATEAEYGLKIQLELRFGKQEGATIWEAINGDFKKLRELAQR